MSKIQSFLVFLGPWYRFGFGFPFRLKEELLLSWFLKLRSTVLYERLLGFRDTFSKLYCYNPEKSASSLFWRGAGSFLIAKAFHSFQIAHISRPFFQIPFFWSYVFSQQLRFLFLFWFFPRLRADKTFFKSGWMLWLAPRKVLLDGNSPPFIGHRAFLHSHHRLCSLFERHPLRIRKEHLFSSIFSQPVSLLKARFTSNSWSWIYSY